MAQLLGNPFLVGVMLHLHIPTPKQQPLQHALGVLAGLTRELPAIGGGREHLPTPTPKQVSPGKRRAVDNGLSRELPTIGGGLGGGCHVPLPSPSFSGLLSKPLPELEALPGTLSAATTHRPLPLPAHLDTPPKPCKTSSQQCQSLPTRSAAAAVGTKPAWTLEALPAFGGKVSASSLPATKSLPELAPRPLPAFGGKVGASSFLATRPLPEVTPGSLPAFGGKVGASSFPATRPLPESTPAGPLPAFGGKIGASSAPGERALPSMQDSVESIWGSDGTLRRRSHTKRRLRHKVKWCLRPHASDDLEMLSHVYGADLGACDTSRLPSDWLDIKLAHQLLAEAGLSTEALDVLEVYAGTANFTAACKFLGLRVGPPIDIKPAFGSGRSWDLLQPKFRRLLWALVVVCKPKWLHSGFPCTFWTSLAHCTRRRSPEEDDATRLRELVHLVLSLQLARWQFKNGRHVSLENPPACASWRMDITMQTLAAIGATKHLFDSCAWGHRDPGNGQLYKKPQCIASTGNLSCLERKCSCGSNKHQVVQGVVSILLPGQTKRVRRSTYAGAYPKRLCDAWAAGVQQQLVAV